MYPNEAIFVIKSSVLLKKTFILLQQKFVHEQVSVIFSKKESKKETKFEYENVQCTSLIVVVRKKLCAARKHRMLFGCSICRVWALGVTLAIYQHFAQISLSTLHNRPKKYRIWTYYHIEFQIYWLLWSERIFSLFAKNRQKWKNNLCFSGHLQTMLSCIFAVDIRDDFRTILSNKFCGKYHAFYGSF